MGQLQVVCLALTSLIILQQYYIFFYKLADPAPCPAPWPCPDPAPCPDEHLLKMLNQYSTYLGELLRPALTQYTKLVSQLKTTGLFKEPPSEAEVISTVLEIEGTLTQLQDLIAEAQILEGSEGDKSDVIMSPSDDVIMPFRVKDKPPKNGFCPDTDTFLVEMERRSELLNTHCKEESPAVRSKISTLNKLIYFKKSQLFYCPVFKSASSNVLAHFCFDYYIAGTCRDRSQNSFNKLYKRFVTSHKNQPGSGFVVVRDPLTRLLSAYINKIERFRQPHYTGLLKDIMLAQRRVLWEKYNGTIGVNKESYKSQLCDMALEHAATIHENTQKAGSGLQQVELSDTNPYDHPPYPTFTEFVSAVLMGADNPHWIPYTQSCGPCGPDKLDFIVRSEQLECELHNMLKVTNNGANIQTFQEPWATNSAPPTEPSLFYRYYSTLSDNQLQGLGEYYRMDCEFYEYDCVEELARIKVFKWANPGYKHFYSESWDGL